MICFSNYKIIFISFNQKLLMEYSSKLYHIVDMPNFFWSHFVDSVFIVLVCEVLTHIFYYWFNRDLSTVGHISQLSVKLRRGLLSNAINLKPMQVEP